MESLIIARQMKAGNRIGRRENEICKGPNDWFVLECTDVHVRCWLDRASDKEEEGVGCKILTAPVWEDG